MSALPQPGAPSPASVASFRAGAMQAMAPKYAWSLPVADAASKNEYPIIPIPQDSYDTIAQIKSQFGDRHAHVAAVAPNNLGAGGVPRVAGNENWVVPFTNEDAAYELRKRDAEEQAEFDAWMMQQLNMADPAEANILQKVYPELYERREAVINTQCDLIAQYAKIQNRNCQSLDDYKAVWRLQTGQIEMPVGPLWDPKEWRLTQQYPTGAARRAFDNLNAGQQTIDDAAWNVARYNAGLFSPIKWLTAVEGGKVPDANRNYIGGGAVYNPASRPYPAAGKRNAWGFPVAYPAPSVP